MKANLANTTVKDIGYLLDAAFLRAEASAPLEKLADLLCSSTRYKVYLEDAQGRLCGVVQAKQIAMEILKLSRQQGDAHEMLPAIVFVLNSRAAQEMAEEPVTIQANAPLGQVLELMDRNHVREIAVVDDEGRVVGILEAKHILGHYLRAKAEASL